MPNHSAFRKRNHRRQSQQSRLELGLCLSYGPRRSNTLDCWRTSGWWKEFRCALGWNSDRVWAAAKRVRVV